MAGNTRGWIKKEFLVGEEHQQGRSHYTDDLYCQYRKHLGTVRYAILLEVQNLVVPQRVRELLNFRKIIFMYPILSLYKVSKVVKADWLLRAIILPAKYKTQIKALDNN